MVFQGGFMCVFWNFQGRLKDLSGLVQGIFRGVLKLFQGCFKSVSKVLKEVSRVSRKCVINAELILSLGCKDLSVDKLS